MKEGGKENYLTAGVVLVVNSGRPKATYVLDEPHLKVNFTGLRLTTGTLRWRWMVC